jgi:hypothetical protein
MLENTILDELVSVSKLPIWKKTSFLGDPEVVVFVAESVIADGGQNQKELELHSGSWPDDGGVKNSPFEPLSMMLL